MQRQAKAPAQHLRAELRHRDDHARQRRQQHELVVQQPAQLEYPVPDHLRVLHLKLMAQAEPEIAEQAQMQ